MADNQNNDDVEMEPIDIPGANRDQASCPPCPCPPTGGGGGKSKGKKGKSSKGGGGGGGKSSKGGGGGGKPKKPSGTKKIVRPPKPGSGGKDKIGKAKKVGLSIFRRSTGTGNHGANCFILFFLETWQKHGGNVFQVAKQCAATWRKMSESEKARYRQRYCTNHKFNNSRVCGAKKNIGKPKPSTNKPRPNTKTSRPKPRPNTKTTRPKPKTSGPSPPKPGPSPTGPGDC